MLPLNILRFILIHIGFEQVRRIFILTLITGEFYFPFFGEFKLTRYTTYRNSERNDNDFIDFTQSVLTYIATL